MGSDTAPDPVQTTNERTYDVLPNPDIFKSYRHKGISWDPMMEIARRAYFSSNINLLVSDILIRRTGPLPYSSVSEKHTEIGCAGAAAVAARNRRARNDGRCISCRCIS